MKNIRFFSLFLLISCSSSKVVTDYDSNIDFTQFQTFDFYEDTGENLNEFDVKRITSILQKELEVVGLSKNWQPDFFIYFNTETSERPKNTLAIGLGSGGRNTGMGVSGGIPIGSKKLNEELSIRFIESKNNQLFWEGSLTSTVKEKRSPEEREFHLREVVQKILKEFPIKK
jgi:hypothetical protein